jgi:hypothetical protein
VHSFCHETSISDTVCNGSSYLFLRSRFVSVFDFCTLPGKGAMQVIKHKASFLLGFNYSKDDQFLIVLSYAHVRRNLVE